jgi:muconolactone delta-isomerase
MYNQFQLAILATEDQIRNTRSRKTLRSRETASDGGIKRIFRLGGDRQVGRR